MAAELEPRILEGRIFTDGVAQTTTREDGGVRVRLTCMPDRPVPDSSSYGGMVKVELPEPVTVKAGEWIAVEIDWLPVAAREDTGQRMHIPRDTTATTAYTGPSWGQPGRTQGAVRDEPRALPSPDPSAS